MRHRDPAPHPERWTRPIAFAAVVVGACGLIGGIASAAQSTGQAFSVRAETVPEPHPHVSGLRSLPTLVVATETTVSPVPAPTPFRGATVTATVTPRVPVRVTSAALPSSEPAQVSTTPEPVQGDSAGVQPEDPEPDPEPAAPPVIDPTDTTEPEETPVTPTETAEPTLVGLPEIVEEVTVP